MLCMYVYSFFLIFKTGSICFFLAKVILEGDLSVGSNFLTFLYVILGLIRGGRRIRHMVRMISQSNGSIIKTFRAA